MSDLHRRLDERQLLELQRVSHRTANIMNIVLLVGSFVALRLDELITATALMGAFLLEVIVHRVLLQRTGVATELDVIAGEQRVLGRFTQMEVMAFVMPVCWMVTDAIDRGALRWYDLPMAVAGGLIMAIGVGPAYRWFVRESKKELDKRTTESPAQTK